MMILSEEFLIASVRFDHMYNSQTFIHEIVIFLRDANDVIVEDDSVTTDLIVV